MCVFASVCVYHFRYCRRSFEPGAVVAKAQAHFSSIQHES